MLRQLLEQGREVYEKHKKKEQLPAVVEEKKKKKKKKIVEKKRKHKNANLYRNYKIRFGENKLNFIERNDGEVNEWDEEDWKAMTDMAKLVRKRMDEAMNELKDEMKRLQKKLVLKDYSIWNEENNEYETSKKRKENEQEEEEEEELEEDSDTGGEG